MSEQHTLTGNIKLHESFGSKFLKSPRNIIVYLPPDYDFSPDRRYPVLYLHDGQNLFDAATAFAGRDWGLDELAEQMIRGGQIEPLIIVGIYNTGEKRIAEYTPVRDQRGRGGRAQAYGRLIVEELQPFVDGQYRTLVDSANTGLGGSSLGGLVTLYLGLQYPEVFGKLIVMSPSVWWGNRAIVREVKKLQRKPGARIWLDTGTCEGQDPESCLTNVKELSAVLVEKGWQLGEDLAFVEDPGAAHDETAWGNRMRDALRFMFPAKSA